MTLTHQQAKVFYDSFGAKQDTQAFYEDPATNLLLANAELEAAWSVFEFGCGTGRLAERLLRQKLPPETPYLGVDVSPTMIRLAQARLAPFGARAKARQSDGTISFPIADASVDRVLSTYVLDLLSEDDTRRFMEEARRVLRPGGRLGLVSVTEGSGIFSRGVMGLVKVIYRAKPSLVGGCRPIRLDAFLDPARWDVVFRWTVAPFGVASAILVAKVRP